MFCSYVSDNNAKHYSRVQSSTESLLTMVLKDRASFAPAPEKLERAPFAILSLKSKEGTPQEDSTCAEGEKAIYDGVRSSLRCGPVRQ